MEEYMTINGDNIGIGKVKIDNNYITIYSKDLKTYLNIGFSIKNFNEYNNDSILLNEFNNYLLKGNDISDKVYHDIDFLFNNNHYVIYGDTTYIKKIDENTFLLKISIKNIKFIIPTQTNDNISNIEISVIINFSS